MAASGHMGIPVGVHVVLARDGRVLMMGYSVCRAGMWSRVNRCV
jgi:hypothetical protein